MEIVGIGQTAYVRGTKRTAAALITEAGVSACRDAEVDPASVDGVILAGGLGKIEDLTAELRMDDVRWASRVEAGGASPVSALGQAVGAIASGRASLVLVATARLGYSGNRLGSGDPGVAARVAAWLPAPEIRRDLEQPYGLIVPMQYYALQATKWFHDYGAPADALGQIAITTRLHADANPNAIMRGRPLTMADYLGSAVVCSPFRLFDCSLESDGAAAVLVAAEPATWTRPNRPQARIAAVREGHPDSPDDIVSRADVIEIGLAKAARAAFDEAGRGPEDIDFAELYDCFTYVVMRQLEELGFCARGESPAFVKEQGIGIDGRLPLNTHGGLLSEAHVMGMNHLIEAVRQLRGEATLAVPGAQTGIVTGYGDLGDGALAVLTRG